MFVGVQDLHGRSGEEQNPVAQDPQWKGKNLRLLLKNRIAALHPKAAIYLIY
jgi:hypothetical protein